MSDFKTNRKSMKLMVKFDAKVKSTQVSISTYTKYDSSDIEGVTPEERQKMVKAEFLTNTKGEGFNISEFSEDLAKFIKIYCEGNGMPKVETDFTILIR